MAGRLRFHWPRGLNWVGWLLFPCGNRDFDCCHRYLCGRKRDQLRLHGRFSLWRRSLSLRWMGWLLDGRRKHRTGSGLGLFQLSLALLVLFHTRSAFLQPLLYFGVAEGELEVAGCEGGSVQIRNQSWHRSGVDIAQVQVASVEFRPHD